MKFLLFLIFFSILSSSWATSLWAIHKYVQEGRLDQSQLIPDPQYRSSPLDYLILSCARSRSTHMISVLQALGFGSQGELLCPWQPVYSAAVYYFRNGTNMSATYYPIPTEEQQAALSALFSHGFPDKRDPRKEFFGSRCLLHIFPRRHSVHSLPTLASLGRIPSK